MTVASTRRGGEWLTEPATAILTRERLSDEQRMIGETAESFVDQEVAPHLDALERKDWTMARSLVRRAAELGLVATDVPEDYGGLELDKVSSVIVGEAVGRCASFATTFGAQTGLTITPLLCFGTDDQKQRYLPRLVTGEISLFLVVRAEAQQWRDGQSGLPPKVVAKEAAADRLADDDRRDFIELQPAVVFRHVGGDQAQFGGAPDEAAGHRPMLALERVEVPPDLLVDEGLRGLANRGLPSDKRSRVRIAVAGSVNRSPPRLVLATVIHPRKGDGRPF